VSGLLIGKLNFASGGIGSTAHLAAELLNSMESLSRRLSVVSHLRRVLRAHRTPPSAACPSRGNSVFGVGSPGGARERRTAHIAALRKRAAETDAKLKRLYDAIENGVADLADPMLKNRIAELKAVRDQARDDAERAEDALDRLGPTITPQAPKTSARQARKRMRTESGGYRRDHLRAVAQRVEVDAKEVRIMGSKSVLLRTLVAPSSVKSAAFSVPSFVPKWRA
jgi:hypothetical protein